MNKNTMMFWQMEDNNKVKDVKKKLPDHVLDAAKYFAEKYMETPTLCFVNTKVLVKEYPQYPEEDVVIDGIKLIGKRIVLPNCLHIGTGM